MREREFIFMYTAIIIKYILTKIECKNILKIKNIR